MKPIACSSLIIEDDEIDRYLLKRLLKNASVCGEIFEAQHGQQAIEFLGNYDENREKYPGNFPPQAIFLDVNMPIMNGFDFLDAFNALRTKTLEYGSAVFVMVTSSQRPEDYAKAASFDCVHEYIAKDELSAEGLNSLLHTIMPRRS